MDIQKYRVLYHLPMYKSKLGKMCNLSPQGVEYLIELLQKDGLVFIDNHQSNKKKRVVTLTEKGAKFQKFMEPVFAILDE